MPTFIQECCGYLHLIGPDHIIFAGIPYRKYRRFIHATIIKFTILKYDVIRVNLAVKKHLLSRVSLIKAHLYL